MDAIEKRVREIVFDHTGIEVDDLNHGLVDDLGCDSIDLVEITMAVEEGFDLEISDLDANGFTTPQKIIDYVKERKQS